MVSDEVFCKMVLQRINYYRLSAYFLPFKKTDSQYKEGTTFDRVYRIYEFDRKMRTSILSILEEIEIYLRTQLSYYHAHKYGPEGYMEKANYNHLHNHDKFLSNLQAEVGHSKNTLFVKHHMRQYDGKFPVWVATELFSFGMLSFFYSDLTTQDQKILAKELFNTTYGNVRSWLKCCTDLRNICAHFGRLYFKVFTSTPATPKDFSYNLGKTLFANIVVLMFLYPDKNKWNNDILVGLKSLIDEYRGDIELSHIGFPDDWYRALIKQ